MKKSKKLPPEVEIMSYGRYSNWDRDSKELPELLDLTEEVNAKVDVEFGMIVKIYGGKGRYLDFEIKHPDFKNQDGKWEAPFRGSFQIRKNPYTFFLGDTIWEPVEDKKGPWTMTVFIDEEKVASKTILLT